MDRRACIWVRLGWLLAAAFLLWILRDHVDQGRAAVVGYCATPSGENTALLVFDYRFGQAFCVQLPESDNLNLEVPIHGKYLPS